MSLNNPYSPVNPPRLWSYRYWHFSFLTISMFELITYWHRRGELKGKTYP
jgi:hypothetical protein